MNKLGLILLCAAGCSSSGLPAGPGEPPVPRALASGQDATSLAVDDAALYFASATRGTVGRVDKASGAVTLLATGEDTSTQLAAAGGAVFYATGQPIAENGAVKRVAVGGGTPAAVVKPFFTVPAFATDGVAVYWPALGEGAVLERTSVDGGAQTDIDFLPAPPIAMAAAGGRVFSLTMYGLYASPVGGTIGQPAPALVQDTESMPAMTADASAVYLATKDGVAAIAPTGGALRTVTSGAAPSTLAVDDDAIYFASGATLARAPKAGGTATATTIATATRPTALVADARTLYFIDGGTIFALAKQ
jgi:hypothetical protein